MKIDFIVNNYLLIWNLLYSPSISIKMHAFKQKLWLTYKKEYKLIEKDKDEILKDIKNFIPDDNTMYSKIEGTLLFERLMADAMKHRLELLKIWDTNKKEVNNYLKDILKVSLDKYNVVVLPAYMDSCLTSNNCMNIGWGKKQDLNDKLDTLCNIIYTIIYSNFNKYEDEIDEKIVKACLELMIRNELYTKLNKTSNKLDGNKDIREIKKQIYPYFLMYMGVDLENMSEYMMRDNQPFDIEKYTNEIQLRKLNYIEFIEFIIRNKKLILKIKKIGLEII